MMHKFVSLKYEPSEQLHISAKYLFLDWELFRSVQGEPGGVVPRARSLDVRPHA